MGLSKKTIGAQFQKRLDTIKLMKSAGTSSVMKITVSFSWKKERVRSEIKLQLGFDVGMQVLSLIQEKKVLQNCCLAGEYKVKCRSLLKQI